MAIVDIFTPCLGIPMATKSSDRWRRWESCSVEGRAACLGTEDSLRATAPSSDHWVNIRAFHSLASTLSTICHGSNSKSIILLY